MIRVLLFCGCIAGVVVVAGCADRRETCLERVYKADLAVKRDWQRQVRDLVVEGRKDLDSVATSSRDLQILILDRKEREFMFLLKTHPEAIQWRGGLSLFRKYKWSDDHARELREHDGKYRELEERIENLRAAASTQAEWTEYRDHFSKVLSRTPGFRGALGVLASREKEIEEEFGACRELK